MPGLSVCTRRHRFLNPAAQVRAKERNAFAAASGGSEDDDEPFIEIEDDEPVDDTEELDDAA